MKLMHESEKRIIMTTVGMEYSYGALDAVNSCCCCIACCIGRGGTVFLWLL